ncbi:GNAT family N-acetyltransferase [Paenisporosarcina sp. TG-14]|uniref:GNAT family N-acetyltransferase n=1 Tax=Paenisporosarcina sp. TG-14 TaxID=1231057 RepID=UPI0002ECF5E1|nr:GNAT family N-acetyltransferase [Paenisporosarcina sp. TG-14]
MTYPRLETKRLQLIELNKSHASTLFKQFSREDVTRYYGMDPFVEVEQAEKMIQSFSTNFERKQSIRWGLQVKETEELVGTIGLNNLQLWSKKCEVGYDLHPDYWSKGYIKEALRAVLPYCFEELNLSRVGATTFPANKASWQLLLKVGFVKEGLLRNYLYQGSQNYDAYIFSITREDWNLATRIIRKEVAL